MCMVGVVRARSNGGPYCYLVPSGSLRQCPVAHWHNRCWGRCCCCARVQGMRVWEWIRHGVGLPQYADAFRQHAISVGQVQASHLCHPFTPAATLARDVCLSACLPASLLTPPDGSAATACGPCRVIITGTTVEHQP